MEKRRREQNRLAQRKFREKLRHQRAMAEHGRVRSHRNLSFDSTCLQDSLDDGTLPGPMSEGSLSSIDSTPSLNLSHHSPHEIGMGDFLSRGYDFGDSLSGGDSMWTPIMDEEFTSMLLNHPEPVDLGVTQHLSESMIVNDTEGIGAIVNGSKNISMSSLHIAAQRGYGRILRLLLEKNADCSKKDSAGLTPLLHATIEGHEAVVELLLSHGASLKDVDNAHRSALHWAVLRRRDGLLRNLLKHCAGNSELLNMQTIEGKTPLFLAVGVNNEVAVELLLEFGADAS